MQAFDLFRILDTVDSTNNYAMVQIHEGMAKHGMAFFARQQTAGKGQHGRTWLAQKDESIALSIIISPGMLGLHEQFFLSAATALTCADFLSKILIPKTAIKWPNDLYINDRKAGGILIENILKGTEWKYSIIGIGINLNQAKFDPTLPNAVSLRQITGKNFDALELAKQLYVLLMHKIDALANENFDQLLKNYNKLLFRKEEWVKLKKGNVVFEAKITGVSPQGALLAQTGTILQEFNYGEVEWILKPALDTAQRPGI